MENKRATPRGKKYGPSAPPWSLGCPPDPIQPEPEATRATGSQRCVKHRGHRAQSVHTSGTCVMRAPVDPPWVLGHSQDDVLGVNMTPRPFFHDPSCEKPLTRIGAKNRRTLVDPPWVPGSLHNDTQGVNMTPRSLKHTPSYEKPLTSDGAKNHDIFNIAKNHIPSRSPRSLGIVSDGEGYGTECHGASVPLIELHNRGQKPQNVALSKSKALHIPSNMLGSMGGTPYAKTQWVGPQQASVPLVHCENWGHKPQSVKMSDL
jgi:hypothetical protein